MDVQGWCKELAPSNIAMPTVEKTELHTVAGESVASDDAGGEEQETQIPASRNQRLQPPFLTHSVFPMCIQHKSKQQ